jgi:hypothetical protein
VVPAQVLETNELHLVFLFPSSRVSGHVPAPAAGRIVSAYHWAPAQQDLFLHARSAALIGRETPPGINCECAGKDLPPARVHHFWPSISTQGSKPTSKIKLCLARGEQKARRDHLTVKNQAIAIAIAIAIPR